MRELRSRSEYRNHSRRRRCDRLLHRQHPLVRTEGLVSLNRLLDRTERIWIDEEVHGPADARKYRYLPTFILRGLTRLNIRYIPARTGTDARDRQGSIEVRSALTHLTPSDATVSM